MVKLPTEHIEGQTGFPEFIEGRNKVILNLVPYIGPLLNEILIDYQNRVTQNRINGLVLILKEKLEKIEAGSISKDYLASDDFYDLTVSTFQAATKIRTKERREVLASLYINGVYQNINYDQDSIIVLIRFISELTEFQILIFKKVQELSKELIEVGNYLKFYQLLQPLCKEFQIGHYEFKFAVNDLESKGLITSESGLIDFNSKSSEMVYQDHREASVYITEFGKKFLTYLNEGYRD